MATNEEILLSGNIETLLRFIVKNTRYKQYSKRIMVCGYLMILRQMGLKEGWKLVKEYWPNEKRGPLVLETERLYKLLGGK